MFHRGGRTHGRAEEQRVATYGSWVENETYKPRVLQFGFRAAFEARHV